MKMVSRVAGLTLIALSLGCSLTKNEAPQRPVGKAAGELTTRQNVIQNLASNVILRTYKNLETRSAALHAQALALQTNKNQQNLDRACDQWRATRISWEQTEGFLFGPVSSLNLDPKLDTWPTNIGGVSRVLDSGSPITVEALQPLDTNLRGFHMIEFLLFGDGLNSNHRNPASITSRELEYLVAATGDLARNASALAFSWEIRNNPDIAQSPSYVDIVTNPGPDNEKYPSEAAVIGELFNGISKIADEVGNGKIAEPLEGDISKIESKFAWNSAADFADNIRSVRMIYTGEAEAANGFGLRRILETQNRELADSIQAQIELAIAKLEAIGESDQLSFRHALEQPEARLRVVSAQAEVQKLFDLLDQRARPYFESGAQ